jgi:hypothetical protein
MGYRDDREALRNEVDTLQKELESARDDQQRLAGLEQRLDAARREVGAIEAELGKARRRTPARRGSIVVGTIGAVVVITAIYGFLFASRPRPVVMPIAPNIVQPPPALPPIVPVAVATAAPLPTPIPAPKEAAPARRANVVWTATVTKSHGFPARPGSTCTIRAGVVPDANGMHATDVEVTCGGLTAYDEKGHLNGMSMLDSDAKQRPGARAGTWVYELAYRDRGDRSATRNQADLDSTAKIGKVWSDNLPEFRIDLAIRPGSAPVDVAVVE